MSNKSVIFLKIGILIALNMCIIGLFCYANKIDTSLQTEVAIEALSKRGSRGDEVKEIQSRLKKWGYYNGNVDGIYGSQTEKAVRYFQRKNGLVEDGIAGKATLAAIGISSTGSSGGGSNTNDYYLLARIISAESRGEPYSGQVAVGAVVLNRVEHPSFPDSVAGVVYQPGAFTAITDGQINESISESSYRAAKDALNGSDPSGGAIYYYNPDKTSNRWIRTRPVITRIGKHLFCS